MKKFWFKKILMMIVCGALAITAFGFIVMLLWNNVLALAVTGIHLITFWQALGILVLSKILFGGFGGRRGFRGSPAWKEKMKQRFNNMTPEEKENFKSEWKNRCGGRWGRDRFGMKDNDTVAAD